MLNPKVEISKEGFLELFYVFNKNAPSMVEAFERAVEHCDSINLPCRFQSYDSFRRIILEKKRKTPVSA